VLKRPIAPEGRDELKSAEEIMRILDAYDLTRSFRDAAELAGCSHNTVKRYVEQRAAGGVVEEAAARPQLIDDYLEKVEELVERSHGKVRADVAHDRLAGMGYQGSERTTRRAVAAAKEAYRDGRVRVHRPWVPEPGMWLQYDYGQGPMVAGVATVLFCAWLAWSRFRVVIGLRDKTLPSVFAALDQTFRLAGGVPTYVLTDNEKTVTTEHIAGIAVRNAQMVDWAAHYAVTVHTCLPADPASKGGSEAAVRISKADLVPTDANLLPEYATFAELEAACEAFTDQVNARPHRITRRPPIEMLAEERARLHPVAASPYTVAFGTTRTVPPNTPMVTFEGGQYSVPYRLPGPDGEPFAGTSMLGKTVWVRGHGTGGAAGGEQVVITYVDPTRGPVEIARHERTTPGSPRVADAHFPPSPAGPLGRVPKAKNAADDDARRSSPELLSEIPYLSWV
jgi:transposase